MELPIDHFRLLGVSPAIDAQSVLRTLQLRLDRPPEEGFTAEALEARAQLLRDSADVLADEKRRRRYEEELTAVVGGEPGLIPALVIPSSREVGGLILLWEAGLGAQAFELASRSLQPPRAPALGSGRESDLALLAGLASRQASEEDQRERHYERAAEFLLKGQQLLQRMGQHHALRQDLARERDALLPYRVLQLLSRGAIEERQEGLALLDRLMERRQGLDGDADPDFARPAFEAFLNQIRQYLTVQEQIDLFERWSQEGSTRAGVLAAMALAASGFAQRKPQRILLAMTRLQGSDARGLSRSVACLTLLLGQVEDAQALFASQHDGASEDSLAVLCQDCGQWLREEVLPGYRDVEIEADLEAWFADRDVQDFIEQQDRRAGRRRSPQSQATTPPFLRSPADAPVGSPTDPGSPVGSGGIPGAEPGPAIDNSQHDPDDSDEDEDLWDGEDPPSDQWRWPALPSLSLPALNLPSLPWPALSLPTLRPLHWGAIGGGVAVVVTLCWTLRPKPQPLAVQPLISAPQVPAPPSVQPPPAVIADDGIPLRARTPDETQIRRLLERWLEDKAQVMAGKPPSTPLEQLANPGQIETLNRSRTADELAGRRKEIEARITDLQIAPMGAETIEARTSIRYGDRVLDRNDQVVSVDPPRVLRNTYIFGRGADGLWRLTDFRPGS